MAFHSTQGTVLIQHHQSFDLSLSDLHIAPPDPTIKIFYLTSPHNMNPNKTTQTSPVTGKHIRNGHRMIYDITV